MEMWISVNMALEQLRGAKLMKVSVYWPGVQTDFFS
jgi:hypothetical protein